MLRLDSISKENRESGALNAYINIQTAASKHAFLTKSGGLLSLIKVRGIDYECLDSPRLEEVTRQLRSALGSLGSDYRVYQYVTKRELAPEPRGTYGNPVVQKVMDARRAHLGTRVQKLYVVELHLAIMQRGLRSTIGGRRSNSSLLRNPAANFRRALSAAKQIDLLHRDLSTAIGEFSNSVNTFIAQLRDTFGGELLTTEQGFVFLRQLVNYAPYKVHGAGLRWNNYVDYQMADSALECHRGHLTVDDYTVKVLTLKDLPRRTSAHVLRGVLEIPAEFVLASEWQRIDGGEARRAIRSKSRHFFNGKTALATHFASSGPSDHDRLIDTGAESNVADLGACLAELEADGSFLGEFSLSAVLFDRDPEQLKKTVGEFFRVFGSREAALTEERYNLLNAWLAVIPGNHVFNLRRMWVTNANYADLALLFTLHAGEPDNRHLRAESLALLETNHRTPYHLNLHHQDVAHTLITGATGSGKSFLLNFLITNLQKYAPRTFIFDLGGSYRDLTRLFGGTYVRVDAGHRSFTINPFSLSPTPENLQFLFQFVRVLVESADYRMTSADEKDLFQQIVNLYEVEPAQRRLLTLHNIVNRNLRNELQKWVVGGQYGEWFDQAEDNLTFASFQTFDFAGMNSVPQVLEPLLFYVLHRANVVIQDSALASTFKVFLLDEAWRFMRQATTKSYIVEALKTWRKKNAAMVLATQSCDDLLQSDMLAVVVESCPTKIFLANPGMDGQAYRDAFHLNQTEARAVSELLPKRQLLLKQAGIAKVLNLNVDSLSYWIYTSDPYDAERKQEALDRLGLEEGLDFLAQANVTAHQPTRSNPS